MATIVQPYNPWREQLALTALGNVAGNIIGDIWARHKQSEENKKVNAFRSEAANTIRNIAGQPDISLNPQNVPDGYNSNPWANAFHKTDTPLTQFDIGTAGIAKTPSIKEIAQGFDDLAATKRFSMLNPETVGKIRNDFIQQAYSDRMLNANDSAERFNIMSQAVMGGVAPYQALPAMSNVYMHDNQPKQAISTNTGDKEYISSFDPNTGKVTQEASFTVGVNPTNSIVAQIAADASRDSTKINAASHATGYNIQQQDLEFRQYQEAVNQNNKEIERIDNDIQNHFQIMDNQDSNELKAAYRQKFIAPLEQKKQEIIAHNEALRRDFFARSGLGQGANLTGYKPIHNNSKYNDFINNSSKMHGVDPDLVYAVIQIESGHTNGLTSSKGAQGLMQLMPDTAKRFGVNDPFDPEQNINGGVAYLKWLLDRYNGNEEKALQAYHCGEGRVARDGTKDKNNVPAVSVQYAKNVLAIANRRRAARSNNSKHTQSQPANPFSAVNKIAHTIKNIAQSSQQTQTATATQPNTRNNVYLEHKDNPNGLFFSMDEFLNGASEANMTPEQYLYTLQEKGFRFPGVVDYTPNFALSGIHGNNYTQEELSQMAREAGLPYDEYIKVLQGKFDSENTPTQYSDTPHARGHTGWKLQDIINWINSIPSSNKNTLGRNFLLSGSDPRNPPHYYFPGNVWQGLTPNMFSELIDGEYLFLDPRMH